MTKPLEASDKNETTIIYTDSSCTCITCRGSGIVDCPACEGTGVEVVGDAD
jgi:DnaJ-class molecular chaperone